MAIRENIEITLTGRNTSGEAFKEVNKAAKDLGRETKDAGEIGKKALDSIASAAGTKLSPAIGGVKDSIDALAKGGLWGGIAAAAGLAISTTIDWLNKQKEAAKEAAKVIGDSLREAFKSAAKEADAALRAIGARVADVTSNAARENAATTSETAYRVAEVAAKVAAEALNETSEEARKAAKAFGALEIAEIESEAKLKKLATDAEAATAAQTAAAESVTAAEKALEVAKKNAAIAQDEVTRTAKSENVYLEGYIKLKQDAAKSIKERIDLGEPEGNAVVNHRKAVERLTAFEEKHADFVEQYSKAVAVAEEADKAVAAASDKLAETQRKKLDADSAAELASRALETASLEASAKIDGLRLEVQNAANAVSEAAKKEAEQHAASLAATEEVTTARKEQAAAAREEVKAAKELEKEQKALAKELQERQAAEDAAKEKQRKQRLQVSIFGKVVAEIPGVEKKIPPAIQNRKQWNQEQKKMAEEARKRQDELNRQVRPMAEYLKKQGQGEWAKKYAQYLLESNMTIEEIQQIGQRAANSQLLSHAEYKKQSATMGRLLTAVQEALTAK